LRRAKPGQAVVVLDPGLSFGTGQHPTTSFCLRLLVNARRDDQAQSFLDIGTGSGILAIAAAKLGYRPVLAFDCDPDAVRVARANARRNRVGKRMRIQEADLRTFSPGRRRGHDVVCANLLANLLVAESGKILQQVKPGGLLVVAGILAREFDCVNRHYIAAGARLLRSCAQREWQSAAYRVPT
jgi:ribosomal protein L11 methyltransferase